EKYHDEDQGIVRQNDDVAAYHLINVDAQRRLHLDDRGAGPNERAAPLRYQARDERKNDHAEREIREIGADVLPEDAAIEVGEPADHHSHAESQPERTDHRSAVSLPNVMPAERRPQLPAPQPFNQIRHGR